MFEQLCRMRTFSNPCGESKYVFLLSEPPSDSDGLYSWSNQVWYELVSCLPLPLLTFPCWLPLTIYLCGFRLRLPIFDCAVLPPFASCCFLLPPVAFPLWLPLLVPLDAFFRSPFSIARRCLQLYPVASPVASHCLSFLAVLTHYPFGVFHRLPMFLVAQCGLPTPPAVSRCLPLRFLFGFPYSLPFVASFFGFSFWLPCC